MKRLFLPLLAACTLLSGCGGLGALVAGLPASPAAVSNTTTLDEKGALAVETLYTAATRAGALAFRTGLVKPSTNPAVQSDGFCPLVLAGSFTSTDRGSAVAALECKLRSARDKARQAYDAANATTYDQATRAAIALANELLALIHGD